ncbi:sulfotransferase domain-containing protein [Sagittula salina]|uniref:Sulfotransferase domain-containing protein n=1 Tax=Sagittula salina TaxID=2820268 RepID=A0A940MSA2_9RHOB|nr:sulfotransferase domain-containing protein [Sagittula salina]MBP0484479.1 sulfotransferase domain-containing protein [Sagittula salina]
MTQARRFLIVVGLPKSGTTFLYAQAARRPDRFCLPRATKEVDYFRRGRDLAEYLSLFEEGEDDRVIFDASPLYIDDVRGSAANMRAALAGHEVKIVVCLRDPLERAYSHYLHDVAQNQKIVGHANYSFWSPSVLAKYLFPVAPRVEHLIEAFGAENVHGFAFGADLGEIETVIRDFAGLEAGWSLDLTKNPAPGFTAPQCFYDGDHESEVPLGDAVYRLPAGHLLVANRQFSLYRRDIGRALAEQLMMRQAVLTRQADTGLLRAETRERIYRDMTRAAELSRIGLTLDPAPRVFHAQVSDKVPLAILNQLTPLTSFEEAVSAMFGSDLRRTMNTIVEMPHAGPSLARDMARLQLAHMRDPVEPMGVPELQNRIIATHGPIPHYIEGLMTREVARGNYDGVLTLFEGFGGAQALLWPMDLTRFLQQRGIVLPAEVAQRFRAAGIRLPQPTEA